MRASFRLDELLPVDEEVEQERDNLSAPSIKLMHTVAAAIREDLAQRQGNAGHLRAARRPPAPRNCAPQTELLRKIGDTLGVLGLGELRSRVQEANSQLLEALVNGQTRPADMAQLVQVAATLIQVEDHLDDAAGGLILPRNAHRRQAGGLDAGFPPRAGRGAARMRVNLARVKESVAQNVNGNLDAAGFDGWPDLMRGIKAGLLMLGKIRAVEILEHITVHLKRVMQPGGSPLAPAGARPPGRCHRQPRVLHGDPAGRAQGPLVHARQCRERAGAPEAGPHLPCPS